MLILTFHGLASSSFALSKSEGESEWRGRERGRKGEREVEERTMVVELKSHSLLTFVATCSLSHTVLFSPLPLMAVAVDAADNYYNDHNEYHHPTDSYYRQQP